MRLITEEEDVLLQKISSYKAQIEKEELDMITYESQVNGYTTAKRERDSKIFVFSIIEAIVVLYILAFAVFMIAFNQLILGSALFFGSGGIGFICLIYSGFYIVNLLKYFCAVSNLSLFKKLANSWGIDSIVEEEKKNRRLLSESRRNVEHHKIVKAELEQEYNELRNELDDEFENRTGRYAKDVYNPQNEIFEKVNSISGNSKFKVDIKDDTFFGNSTDFQSVNNFIADNSDASEFYKLQAEYFKLSSERIDLEEDSVIYNISKENCSNVIRYFITLIAIIIILIIGFYIYGFTAAFPVSYLIVMKRVGYVALIVALLVFAFVLFIFCPYYMDNSLAKFSGSLSGIDQVCSILKKNEARTREIDSRIIEIKEEMKIYKNSMKK